MYFYVNHKWNLCKKSILNWMAFWKWLVRHPAVTCTYSVLYICTQQAEEDGVTDVDGSPLDIKEKMDPWVDQRGYPLVSVSRETVGDSRNVNFRQQHFIDPRDEFPESPFEWAVDLKLVAVKTCMINTGKNHSRDFKVSYKIFFYHKCNW